MHSGRLLRGLFAVVFSAVAVAVSPTDLALSVSSEIDDGFYEDDRFDGGFQGVRFREQPPWESTFSWLQLGGKTCEDIAGNCLDYRNPDGSMPFAAFNSLLGPCRESDEMDCIEQVQARIGDGPIEIASFDRPFPEGGANDFRGDSTMKLPSGGPAGVWRFSSIRHAGGADFFLRVGVAGRMDAASSASASVVDPQTAAVHAAFFAVEEIAANCTEDGIRMFCGPRKPTFDELRSGTPLAGVLISPWSGVGWSGPTDCVMTSRNRRCLQRRALPRDLSIKVILRLSQSPSGWLHGRLAEPEAQLAELGGGIGYRLTLGGMSISVPVVKSGGKFAELPTSIQEAYRATGGFKSSPGFTRDFGIYKSADPVTRNSTSTPLAYGKDSFDELALWLPHVGDRASGNLSTWSIRTIPSSEISPLTSTCFKVDGTLKGLVATNASVYSAGPPTFDAAEGSLNYRVAAPHYTSGMQEFFGTYDLVMRSDTARCIYGLQNVPVNATISVVEGDETATVATKIVSERNGWLRLAAYGFGFSAPTIKVKLTAEPIAATVVKKPVPRTVSSKKPRSVTCVKGKFTRIVTNAKQMCPKGFKMK